MYEALRRLAFDANMKLPRLGLVIYTFGNVSAADCEHGVYAIKPSGVDYDALLPEDMVVVSIASGEVVEGRLRPSSDTNTHTELYRAFPGLGGIVHTHSTEAVAWAQAARSVPLYGTTHADHLAADIPCTEFMPDERIRNNYETETGLQIVECFRRRKLNPAEVPMVLVAGHGPFAWGATADKAVYHARVLEELCRMARLTEEINPEVPRLKDSLIARHYERKHGQNAYYGQEK